MDYAKFIVSGEDKKLLGSIKNVLVQSGHIFVGYSREPVKLLRYIRIYNPELVVLEVSGQFSELSGVLEVIDEELLSACVLLLESRNEEVFEFLRRTRAVTYIAKPVFNEVVVQMADMALTNFRRIVEYENRVKKLSDTLESRKIIEKAKWLLIEQDKLTEAEAYEAIKKKSRNNRVPMRDIAEAIIITRDIDKT